MEILEIDRQRVSHHETLLNLCFPHSKLNRRYLDWLYFSNPLGDVVGFDAMEGNVLAAHYACIPTRIGDSIGLLSLNTATHPGYRSKGLYQKLAQMTYERWSNEFNYVVGVANANSASIFVKRLGFAEIGRLNLRFGDLRRPTSGSRSWLQAELDWRVNSPRRQLEKKIVGDGLVELSMRPRNLPFKIKSIIPIQDTGSTGFQLSETSKHGFTVDWIRGSKSRIHLPEKLKPSPLVLIYQTLNNSDTDVNSWSFPDFDAF